MPEKIPPWDTLRKIVSTYAHDHTGKLATLRMSVNQLQRVLSRSEIREFKKTHGGKSPSQYVEEVGGKIVPLYRKPWRYTSEPPKDYKRKTIRLRSQVAKHQREMRRRAKEVLSFACGKAGVRREDLPDVDKLSLDAWQKESERADAENDISFYAGSLKGAMEDEKGFDPDRLVSIKPQLQEIDLHRELRGYSRERHVDRNGRSVKVRYRGKNVGRVSLDPHLFFNCALDNLVEDAIMHGDRNTPVTIELEKKRGKVLVHVTNQGPKLSPEDLEAIGQKRWTTHPEDPKRGWGKVSANLIMEAHGKAMKLPGGGLQVENHTVGVRRKGKVFKRHHGPRLTLVLPQRRKR